ncbi:PhzF family phenazine biosynthesis protein [Granulicella arctica]|uniref:PhzF family phenazine biosynthesis protein n=1 Tax=Granulicella arctica TaxID=940613 RepID=UPI0021E08593|nr:PhzF family phenazine biosynthesis protein [Granulicella arctica]
MSNHGDLPEELRSFNYSQVDVFAERAMEGNALAIFTDARGLSTEEMQALARETNLSETTFIIPRDEAIEREHGVQVRIFTTQEELRFAGHPTLGTASWLYWKHPVFKGAEQITLDLPVGRIPVRFSPVERGQRGVFGTMHQNDPSFGHIHDPGAIAEALGLTVEDLDPLLPIQTVSTGMAFCIVPLRSMEVAARLQIPYVRAQTYLDHSDAKFFHCITRAEAASGADWHARMQFYNGEDPATGSASGCTIAYLVQHGLAVSGQAVVIEQGIEMLRPSRIHVQATSRDNSISGVFVGGRTILVAKGRLFIP